MAYFPLGHTGRFTDDGDSCGVTAILTVVNSFNAAVVAGFGASQRIDSLIVLPAMALGVAVNSMAGQNIGAGRWDRVRQIAIYGAFFNFAIMFSIALFIYLSAGFLIRMFVQEEGAVTFGEDFLRLVAFFYPFLGLNFIFNGIVRGAGAMYPVLVLNTLSFWLLRYPLTYFFSGWIGEDGIALGMGVSFVISSFFSFAYFKWGKWKEKKLFAERGEWTAKQ